MSDSPRFISEADVRALVTMADALAAVEGCFRRLGAGQATQEPRRRARAPAGLLHVMFGADPEEGVLGLKSYTSFAGTARFHVLLYSALDGRLLALIEAGRLGELRTGAATGLATRLLARPGAAVAAVFGAGRQAETQIEALAHARDFTEFRVYSRDPERRRAFCADLCARFGLWVLPTESPEAALTGADVVTTITTASRPVFPGALLAPGAHVNAAGSNSLLRREIDEETVCRAGLVVVDSAAAVPLEGGDLLGPLQKGLLYPEALVELADVVAGRHPGRESDEQITLFKSHGVAAEDVALAALVYRRALEQGRGTPLPP
jgi:alanine dehydrogenase